MANVTKESKEFTLGSGEIWFAQLLANGTHDGFRYVKETPQFNITVESETVEVMGSDAEIAKKVRETEVRRSLSAAVVTHSITDDNLYMFFAADSETVTEAADSVVDEEFDDVTPGRSYRVGVTALLPRGVRNISDVSITDDTTPEAVVFEEGVDYEVDYRRGMFFILEDGNITKGTNLLVSYDHGGVTYKVGSAKGRKSVEGIVLYKAKNTDGENRDYEMRNVVIRPQGEIAVKGRDAYQTLPYQFEILEDAAGVSLYLENEPVELPA